jgi:chemotaxis methyl-accepting protein methylase
MYRGVKADRFKHIVFPREEIRRQAVNLAARGACAAPLEPRERARPSVEMEFVTWLFARSGLDAQHYRPETLHRRLPACLRTLRTTSVRQARQLLEQNPSLQSAATSAILVGVTSFFRDPIVFDQIEHELLRDATVSKRGLYAWSIGCSDGAELYSFALVLADLGILADSYLLGTDCRADAVENARRGNYDASIARQVTPAVLDRHFMRNGNCFQISTELRQAVRWRVSSVLSEFETGLWDIIFFRNTAMYFQPETTLALWPKFESALRPGGLLVLGRAERANGVQRLRAVGPCLYRRQPR